MKRLYYILFFLILTFCFHIANGQNYNMSNGTFSVCSGTFYDSGGSAGDYLNSESYTMTFCSSSPGNNIQFAFTSFNTESCCDHLSIYDGPNTSSPLIGTYQGTVSPGTVTSTSGCLTFVYTSDGSVVYSGWQASIVCIAPPVGYNMGNLGTISTCSGYFYDSGTGTGNYSDNENYTATFCSSSPGIPIKFVFTSFSTNSSSDYLIIYNGPNTGSPIIGTYSGSTSPGTIVASGTCLTFVFVSNNSGVGIGWSAIISCSYPTYNMSNGTYSVCSGTFYDSGGLGGDYLNSESYTMTFCSSTPGYNIQFNFTSFNIESCCDHLSIYDGPNTSSPLIGTYQGTISPGTITSTSGCLTFVYTSDGSVVYSGWEAAISCVAPPPGYNMGNLGTISTCSGIFYDSGGGLANYGNNENYTATFCSSISGNQIAINFSSFITETGTDILTIYDGPNTSSPVIGTYSGTASPGLVASSNGCLTFTFSSNGSVNNNGWVASISCAPPSGCNGSQPFCTGTTYNFPAATNVPNMGTVGCLYTTPNPAFYYLQIGTAGPIDIVMQSTANVDIDFIIWGPFTSLAAACASNLMANTGVDCSYSTAAIETANLPNTQVGEIYVLLITNYSNQPTNITFSQSSGSGATNCNIVAPPVTNNGPLCVGQTLQLTVSNPTPGATYSWTGPNGFSSSLMNPTVNNVTSADAGVYSLTITVGSTTSLPVTTTVVINPNPIVTVVSSNSTICSGTSTVLTASGASTYTWSGGLGTSNPLTVAPTSTTTYTVTGTSLGCTGTAAITITINPNPLVSAVASPTSICAGNSSSLTASGANSYVWSGSLGTANPISVTPSTTTSYTVTGTSLGCTGTAIVTVTIIPNPIITATANPSTLCLGASTNLTASGASTYNWSNGLGTSNPVSVTPATSSTYTVTGTNLGCTGTAMVSITVNPNPVVSAIANPSSICIGSSANLSASGATTYNWSGGLGSLNPVNVTPSSTTTYSVTGSSLGCTGTATVTVTVNPLPVINFPVLTDLCLYNPPLILNAATPSGGTYSGNGVSGGSFDPTTSGSGSFNLTYTYTDGNNCTNSASQNITVYPTPSISISPPNPVICAGNSVQLTASGATTYNWSPSSGLNSQTGSAVLASPLIQTTYTVTGSMNGCTNTATVMVDVYNSISVYITPSVSYACPGQGTLLTASGGVNYHWSPGTGLSSQTGSTVTATPTATTTYTVIGSDAAGCSGSTTALININPLAYIGFTATPKKGCEPLLVDFLYAPSNFITDSSWHWSFGDFISGNPNSSNDTATSHLYSEPGIYLVTLTALTQDGCNVSAHDTIEVYEMPLADFFVHPNVATTETPEIHFYDNSTTGYAWSWDFGDPTSGISNYSINQNPEHHYDVADDYLVTMIVTTEHGCMDTAVYNMIIHDAFSLFIPNAFSPNGDLVNDQFLTQGIGFQENTFKMRIFDRWGEQICYTEDIEKGWDGKDQKSGKIMPDGIYAFLINVVDDLNIEHQFTGTITLLK
jgi:gliding motility-associated-like protein